MDYKNVVFIFTILNCFILENQFASGTKINQFNVTIIRQKCASRATCSTREDKNTHKLLPRNFLMNYNCYCDVECPFFKDCCQDTNKMMSDIFSESDIKMKKYFGCVNVTEVDDYNGVYLISKCPTTWTQAGIRDKCEGDPGNETLLRLPVMSVLEAYYFKNRYCALCHGHVHGIYWDVTIGCEKQSLLDRTSFAEELKDGNCGIKFTPPGYPALKYRTCMPAVGKCDKKIKGTNLNRKCHTGMADYVYTNTNTYKNVYCAACNYVSVDDLFCDTHDTDRGRQETRFYPMTLLFNINDGERYMGRGSHFPSPPVRLRCETGHDWDPVKGECVKLWCQTDTGFVAAPCGESISTPDYSPLTGPMARVVMPRTTVPTQSDPECVWVKLNNTEYHLQKNGTILYSIQHDKEYVKPKFFIEKDHGFICTLDIGGRTGASSQNETSGSMTGEEIVSGVGMIISVIALLITLTVYCLLSALRNVPGLNVMNLVSAMLLSNLLYLIAPFMSSNREACISFAVLLHFLFLATFLWMNVMSFDIFYTFTRKTVHVPIDGITRRFRNYMLYAWITAIAITTLGIIADYAADDFSWNPAYGRHMCWFSNPYGLLMFFTVPVMLIVLTNIVFYALTVRSIVLIDKSTKAVQTTSDKKRFFLYVKLCFIMGTTWIFGFINAFVSNVVLRYLFIVFTSFQGLFICISFVCTRKVCHLLKERFLCEPCTTHRKRMSSDISGSKTSLSTRPTVISDVLASP